MPIILHRDLEVERFSQQSTRRIIVSKELGAASLTVEEELMEPGMQFTKRTNSCPIPGSGDRLR